MAPRGSETDDLSDGALDSPLLYAMVPDKFYCVCSLEDRWDKARITPPSAIMGHAKLLLFDDTLA